MALDLRESSPSSAYGYIGSFCDFPDHAHDEPAVHKNHAAHDSWKRGWVLGEPEDSGASWPPSFCPLEQRELPVTIRPAQRGPGSGEGLPGDVRAVWAASAERADTGIASKWQSHLEELAREVRAVRAELATSTERAESAAASQWQGHLKELAREVRSALEAGAERAEAAAASEWQSHLEACLEKHTASVLAVLREDAARVMADSRGDLLDSDALALCGKGDVNGLVSASQRCSTLAATPRLASVERLDGTEDEEAHSMNRSAMPGRYIGRWPKAAEGQRDIHSVVLTGQHSQQSSTAAFDSAIVEKVEADVQVHKEAGEVFQSTFAASDKSDRATGSSWLQAARLSGMLEKSGVSGEVFKKTFSSGTETHPTDGSLWLKAMRPSGMFERSSKMCRRRLSKPLDVISTLVLLANVAFVTYVTDREMKLLQPLHAAWATLSGLAFTSFFVVEIALRLFAEGRDFFSGSNKYWNVFDVVVLVISILIATGWNFLRTLRVLKVIQLVRSVRVVAFMGVEDLQRMIHGLSASLKLLLWCSLMILFLAFLFSIFFVQGMYTEIMNTQRPFPREQVERMQFWFGSVGRGIVTLLMVTTGGTDWKEVYEDVQPAGPAFPVALLVYVILFIIAVSNVLTSMFVDNVMKFARLGDESTVREQQRVLRHDARELQKFFAEVDVDSSGTISFQEFNQCLRKPDFHVFLRQRGLDVQETKAFFRMLQAQGGPELTIGRIVSACMRLRGMATSLDLHLMHYDLQGQLESQLQLLRQVSDAQSALQRGPHARRPLCCDAAGVTSARSHLASRPHPPVPD